MVNATIERPVKVGIENSRSSNIGLSIACSMSTKATNNKAEPMSSPTISLLAQPSSLPRMSANTSRKSAPVQEHDARPVGRRVGALVRLRQPKQRDSERREPDRHIDVEDPLPGRASRSARRPRAARPRRQSRSSPDPERRAAVTALELQRDQRERGREHDRAADALRAAGEGEEERRRCEAQVSEAAVSRSMNVAVHAASSVHHLRSILLAFSLSAVLYQRSQCAIVSSGLRRAGLKSVPSVYATGSSAVCMTSS